MPKLRLHCATVKVDKRYEVTSGEFRTYSATNNLRQVCVIPFRFSCRYFNVPNQLCVRPIGSFGRALERNSKDRGSEFHMRLTSYFKPKHFRTEMNIMHIP